jgi:OmpA-OmpF porin, OOP family
MGLEEFMKLMRGAIVSGAILLATATSGYAQSWIPNGVYLRGDVGGAFGVDNSFKDTSPTSPLSSLGTTRQIGNPGNSIMFGGGVGYRFTPMFRSDFTLDYIPSFKETTHNSAVPALRTSAGITSLVGMVNGYLDLNGFAPTMFGPFQPYIDAGVGFAHNDLHKAMLSLGGTNIGLLNGASRTELAWGAGAGVAYSITPNLALDLAYKYLDLGEMRTGTRVTTLGVASAVTATKADLQAHTVTLGVRWTFGAPPAPPPAAPVAAPPAPPPAAVAPQQQMFIVFFEFDKSTLTADGKRVVDAAAAAFKSGKSGVAISGYTDLAGTQQYNLALSKRRADAVKSALVRDGVPAGAINESWHGKENPRVPTADGVREPQNRRVEISM